MKDELATGHSPAQRIRIAQIANDALGGEVSNVVETAGRPHQQPQLCASREQLPGNMAAQKSSRSCDETFHETVVSRQPPVVSC